MIGIKVSDELSVVTITGFEPEEIEAKLDPSDEAIVVAINRLATEYPNNGIVGQNILDDPHKN
jgi:hypothetical protein